VVLLDVALPRLNGWQVAKTLRKRVHKRMRIIAITDDNDNEARLRSFEAGIDLHLPKPVDLERLLPLLGNPWSLSDAVGSRDGDS
jgi:DNA-binding response OmpR family regulator